MFDPRPDLGRPDGDILSALRSKQPAPAEASDPMALAVATLAAACATRDPAAIDAALLDVARLRAALGGDKAGADGAVQAGTRFVAVESLTIAEAGRDFDATLDQLEYERAELARLRLTRRAILIADEVVEPASPAGGA